MEPSKSRNAPVTEFAGQLFFRIWRASHVQGAAALETVGLTPGLFAVLNVVGARKGAIQQELGSLMGIDRTTMVSLVDQLERDGLAKRRPSPKDRRAREISITPSGRRVLRSARRLLAQAEDEVLAGLSDEERHQLLTLIRQALEEAPTQPPWSSEEGD
jgi:DNA-binding MarR family transcriptional regulator